MPAGYTDECYIVCFVSPLGLCALDVEIKGELNKQKYFTN